MCVCYYIYGNTAHILTSAGIVRRPVFAGHAHHLWALGLISLLAAYFAACPHHILVVLSSGCAAAHVAMFHFNGRAPRCPYSWRKDGCIDLFFVASQGGYVSFSQAMKWEVQLLVFNNRHLPEDIKAKKHFVLMCEKDETHPSSEFRQMRLISHYLICDLP